MTNDFTQLFAGFQLPGTDKFQTLFADAGARGQESPPSRAPRPRK